MGARHLTPDTGFSWLIRDDRPIDLVHVVGLVAGFAVAATLVRQLGTTDQEDLGGPSLLISALAAHRIQALAILVVAIALLISRRQRLVCPWHELDHGRSLRLVAAAPIALLAWQGALYDQNYILARWHATDRALIVVLAAGCVWRPVFLLLFAAHSRVIAAQFEPAFHTTAAQNIDALPIIVVVAIATTHLWYAATGRNRSEPVLLILAAAVASHFFVPGKSKLDLDWARTTNLSNLPLSANVSGWQAGGDGSWARSLSSLLEPINRPLLVAVQVFELGSLIAVLHRRLFRWWLGGAALFHVALFAMTGYWFVSWVIVELVLVGVLGARDLRPWVDRNATPARALLTAAMVLFGAHTLFQPPGLAWLDAPVSYGYEVEAVGSDGERVSVPISAFAPFEQELAFGRLGLAATAPLSAGYGAVASEAEFHALDTIDSVAELAAHTRPTDADLLDRSQNFVIAWFDHVNRSDPPWWSVAGPPDHFWTSASDPAIPADASIEALEVYQLTAIHQAGRSTVERTLVMQIRVDDDGHGVMTFDPSAS